MKKLNDNYKKIVIDYLSLEPEMNLFLLGDIETFGLSNDTVMSYTDKTWSHGKLPFFLFDYLGDFLIYSQESSINAEKIASFIKEKDIKHINGKSNIINQLLPYFPSSKNQNTILARLNKYSFNSITSSAKNIRRLNKDDLEEIYNLYIQIDEFKSYYKDCSKNDALKKIYTDMEVNGRIYGAFLNDQLISVARTTAETKKFAMIVGVSTLPKYRRQGFASHVLSFLCEDCLSDDMDFLCLFYDNPLAGSIYNKIGFNKIGTFSMLTI